MKTLKGFLGNKLSKIGLFIEFWIGIKKYTFKHVQLPPVTFALLAI